MRRIIINNKNMSNEKTRAEIEALRGITRVDGKIVRSKDWLENRIKLLNLKIKDFDNRVKNAKEEIKQRTKELKELNS
jgi:hypothetical protein